MSSRSAYISAWLVLAATFVGSLIAYPYLPAVMATHWGIDGQVNGTMNAFAGAFLLPFIMFAVLLILTAIPYIDPMRSNIESFRRQYNGLIAVLMLVLATVQTAVLSVNLGALFNVTSVILPAVGIMIFYLGIILPQTKRNWFIGIRTPWTISSDEVWDKTHELGGRLFQILGVVIVLSVFAPVSYQVWIIVAPLVVIVVGLFLYSYALYQKLPHKKMHNKTV